MPRLDRRNVPKPGPEQMQQEQTHALRLAVRLCAACHGAILTLTALPTLRRYNYVLACERMLKRVGPKKGQHMVEPFCSFCANLFDAVKNPARAKTVRAKCNKEMRLVDCEHSRCTFTKLLTSDPAEVLQ
mmetsp:Transcript_8884/g.22585  ORF Transcript_8884/g.22585 Transcript_8884/m.22585 type:complete len:130 (-) Transcript_8884:432-821(-)